MVAVGLVSGIPVPSCSLKRVVRISHSAGSVLVEMESEWAYRISIPSARLVLRKPPHLSYNLRSSRDSKEPYHAAYSRRKRPRPLHPPLQFFLGQYSCLTPHPSSFIFYLPAGARVINFRSPAGASVFAFRLSLYSSVYCPLGIRFTLNSSAFVFRASLHDIIAVICALRFMICGLGAYC